ncbi:glycosyltransferase family 17 protein [Methylomonas rapida]|uniref:Beta-1,4-mannosyl-glycoprotein beta-1,4-N-acetylglucosaminyltransferase n=1 Tax=Methylomonas rapida TaxID=2963939 RepID=A0ABY7GLD0_9GAMM|nr:hypothetical protein [Methylomonas rapida]WAR45307.1 hypothetical protein NM686_001995 [Methylomonas rapida]
MNPKIYDCFCYFNEDMLLELRLETLWNHVDYFVIVESTKTISGNEKPINFDLEKFKKFKQKIRYLLIQEHPFDTTDAWRNERYQRDYIENGLFDAEDHDWIMISDLDEIPRPEAIKQFNPEKYLRGDFEQYAYSYYLNNICVNNGTPIIWHGSRIVTFKNFKQFFRGAERVRNYKSSGMLRGLKRYWLKKFKTQYIANGGWHFTWIADISQMIKKLESFAHQEYNTPEYKDPEKIKEKINNGLDILNPTARFKCQPINDDLPAYLIQNQDKYARWLRPVNTE